MVTAFINAEASETFLAPRLFLTIVPIYLCANPWGNRSSPAAFYCAGEGGRSLSLLYSALASLRTRKSESAFFHRVKNSRYLVRLFSVSPACAYERARARRAIAPH